MRWRFTARRTTETVTIERDDTDDPAAWPPAMHQWQVIREPPPAPHPLDTTRPWPLTEPAPIFWRLVKHPPVTAPWRSRLGFTVDETARATGDTAGLDPLPPVPYQELTEDTLAGEYAAGYLP
jgi:hypothetical protein